MTKRRSLSPEISKERIENYLLWLNVGDDSSLSLAGKKFTAFFFRLLSLVLEYAFILYNNSSRDFRPVCIPEGNPG